MIEFFLTDFIEKEQNELTDSLKGNGVHNFQLPNHGEQIPSPVAQ